MMKIGANFESKFDIFGSDHCQPMKTVRREIQQHVFEKWIKSTKGPLEPNQWTNELIHVTIFKWPWMHWLDVWVPLCVKTQLLYNWSICSVDIPAHRYSQTGRQDLCRLCACYSYIWKPVNTILWEIHVINNNYWSSLVSSDTLSVAYWPLCWKECCPLIWPRQELMMSSWCKAGVKPSILPVSENLTKENLFELTLHPQWCSLTNQRKDGHNRFGMTERCRTTVEDSVSVGEGFLFFVFLKRVF